MSRAAKGQSEEAFLSIALAQPVENFQACVTNRHRFSCHGRNSGIVLARLRSGHSKSGENIGARYDDE
jgi:hypothetical protein